MAIPAGEIGARVLSKHRQNRAKRASQRRYGRRRGESHAQHAERLRRAQRAHEEAARTTSSSESRRVHEAEASTIESHAGEAEYAAAAQEAKSSTGGGELPSWEPALFLLVGSSLTLWLLLTGHLRAAGQAIGWIPLGSGTAKSSPLNKARQVAHG